MKQRSARPVVVGIDDGDDGHAQTLDVALREAALRGVPLDVVHASRRPADLEADQARVDAVVERIRALAPHVPMAAVAVAGSPYEVLLAAAHEAELLVAGGQRRDGAVLGRGLAQRLVAHAPCPVLVVHDGGQLHVPRLRGLPVIAGVDGTARSEAVLAYAFEAAAARCAPLAAVHVWRHPIAPGGHERVPLVYRAEEVGQSEAVLLAECLAGWSQRYPHVRVEQKVLRAAPGEALIEQSARAQLVVIGAPRHAHPGSVASALIRHAHCPVVVMRPAAAGVLAGTG
jgi:nucleotide-binding universal stress UspA family protein